MTVADALKPLLPKEPGGRRTRARRTSLAGGLVRASKGFVPLALLLLAWQFIWADDPLRFPKPTLWPEAVREMHENGVLLPAAERSLTTFAVALVLAVALGSAVGLIVGAAQPLERALGPTFDFFRGLPVPVLIPVSILLLGSGLSTNIAVVVFAIVWPVLLNTILARRALPRVRLDCARTLELGRFATLRKIIVPSVFPAIMVGVRISASLGIITTLVVEMISGGGGIGFLLMERQSRFDAPGMWGLLALVGVFGFLMNTALQAAEDQFLRRWSPAALKS